MFSGLVEAKAQVLGLEPEPGGIRLIVQRPDGFDRLAQGESIAISGCCLTLVAWEEGCMSFQAGEETLSKTTLGELQTGDYVNCERSLRLGDRIGGHLVTGHVDGVGQVARRQDSAEWAQIEFEAPSPLARQMAAKGSITVDGVSLTLVEVTEASFSVALIPHTLTVTTLGNLRSGSRVNLETDLLAKYVQRQMETQR